MNYRYAEVENIKNGFNKNFDLEKLCTTCLDAMEKQLNMEALEEELEETQEENKDLQEENEELQRRLDELEDELANS